MSGSKADRAITACLLLLLACCANAQNLSLTPASATTNTGTATAVQFPQGGTTTPPVTPPAPAPATPDATSATATAAAPPAPAPATAAPPPASAATSNPAEPQEPKPAGPAGTFTLSPFDTIVSCVPFNILVAPSTDNMTYSVSTALGAEVEAAVRFRVLNRTLYVGFNRSFETDAPIKVTIALPPASLLNVTNQGFGDIYLNEGFTTATTNLAAHSTGNVLARSLNTTHLTVLKTGVADVFAKGAISTANVTATGAGQVTIAGVQQSLSGRLDGIVSLFVDAASEETAINVEAQGLSKVYHTQGKCEAGKQVSIAVPFFSLDLGMPSCLKVRSDTFPRYKAFWSCGMKVTGAALCTPDATAAEAAAADSAEISVADTEPSDGAESTDDNTAAADTSSSSSSSSSPSSSSAAATPPVAGQSGPSTSTAAAAAPNEPSGSVSLLMEGPSDPDTAQLAGEANIGLDRPAAAGRRLHKFLWLPEFDLPTFTTTRSDDDEADEHDSEEGDGLSTSTVTVSVGQDGRRSTSTENTARISVKSVECQAKQQELYIPAR